MNIYQRLNKVRESVGYLQKDKRVGSGGWGYMAVTHDAVTAAVRPLFIEQGIVVVPRIEESNIALTGTTTSKGVPFIRYEGRFSIAFVNADDPQDRIEVRLDAHAIDDADKAPGKAASYATKYAMLKLLSIETGEEEERRPEQKGKKVPIEKQVQMADIKPTAGVLDELDEDQKVRAQLTASLILDSWDSGDQALAFDNYTQALDDLSAEEMVAAWKLLEPHPKLRSAMKKMKRENDVNEQAGQQA